MSDMPEGAKRVPLTEVEERERRGGGAFSRDIAGALGSETMTLRCWRFPPGGAMAYHRHRTQEELYTLIRGGPQKLEVEGVVHEVADGDWIRVSKDTARRIVNDSDREATWLIAGAPPGEGIMDGIRIDPATGEEIPR